MARSFQSACVSSRAGCSESSARPTETWINVHDQRKHLDPRRNCGQQLLALLAFVSQSRTMDDLPSSSIAAVAAADHGIATSCSSATDPPTPTKVITKSLGNKSYSLNSFRHDKSNEPWTLGTLAVAALKPAAIVVFSPVIATFGTIFFAVMAVGPNAIKNKILSVMIPRIMKNVAKTFDHERKMLLSDISENDRVLDVGSGGGAYLRHCTKAREVVALEPLGVMHDTIRQSASDAGIDLGRVTILTDNIETYLQKNPSIRGTFDWVILGNVLCEVPDQLSTLAAAKDVLNIGGRAYFMEHMGNCRGTISRNIQDWVNPVWRIVSGGCNCNRDTIDAIRSVDGWEVVWWQFESIKVCMGPFVVGLAQKKV